jgi:hypothetical protein
LPSADFESVFGHFAWSRTGAQSAAQPIHNESFIAKIDFALARTEMHQFWQRTATKTATKAFRRTFSLIYWVFLPTGAIWWLFW